ncbi:MAG: CopD family protein [Gammaproteobacteria bacterium]|nr:CopD family protein [Gammaproteobacteria bacterium]
MIEQQILVGLHILMAALFVGSNVFLDFLLTPRLDLIPPGQAARLGEKLGYDFAILNWISLFGLPVTGLLLLQQFGNLGQIFQPDFYAGSYGLALLVMMLLWLSLALTGAYLTWILRPRAVVKLPYDASRQDVEDSRAGAIAATEWMRRLARFNAVASVVAVLVGGFLRFGGFPW